MRLSWPWPCFEDALRALVASLLLEPKPAAQGMGFHDLHLPAIPPPGWELRDVEILSDPQVHTFIDFLRNQADQPKLKPECC